MSNPPWVAYVGAFRFPEGQASARRIYGIARSLAHAGYSVTIGSGESGPTHPELIYQDTGGSVAHIGLAEMPNRGSSLIHSATRWLITLGARTIKWLNQQADKPAYVVSYCDNAAFTLRLLAWCQHNKIPLIFDVVEWYDSSHMLGGPFGPLNISAKLSLRVIYPKGDGIIAISSFLDDYYRQKECWTVRVPPTLDVRQTEARLAAHSDTHRPLILAYAGVPGKKDLINNIIEAVMHIDSTGRQVRLTIAGSTVNQILAMPALHTRGFSVLPGCINALGMQSHASAIDLIRNADFTPLLRLPLRYAQAGFPTKATESLSVGTPLICNLTSDLRNYIHDSVEGFVCRDHTVSAITEALEQALMLNPKQRIDMRYAARKQAEQSFDYRLYAEPLTAFFDGV